MDGLFLVNKVLTERNNLNPNSKASDIKKYMELDPIVKELQDLGAIYLLSKNPIPSVIQIF